MPLYLSLDWDEARRLQTILLDHDLAVDDEDEEMQAFKARLGRDLASYCGHSSRKPSLNAASVEDLGTELVSLRSLLAEADLIRVKLESRVAILTQALTQ